MRYFSNNLALLVLGTFLARAVAKVLLALVRVFQMSADQGLRQEGGPCIVELALVKT